MANDSKNSAPLPRIVIVGAGFGGLACAHALGNAPAQVTIVDRRNFHLFSPLLYQVATAVLSPADIAQPIRRILSRFKNIDVLLDEVTSVDFAARQVILRDAPPLPYDRLVIAAGSQYSYFGHDDWAEAAPGLKTLEDALAVRASLLRAFERAEMSRDLQEQIALTTTIVVGGGPTGVEMAGSVAELDRHALARDFRHVRPEAARIILVEAAPRILLGFPEALATYAQERLERLGVTVWTGKAVEEVAPGRVRIAGEWIEAGTIIWGAGVKASPAAGWIPAEYDRSGRVIVASDLSVPGLPGVFVIGDLAHCKGRDGQPLPGLAQVANQQGKHLGRAFARNPSPGAPLPRLRVPRPRQHGDRRPQCGDLRFRAAPAKRLRRLGALGDRARLPARRLREAPARHAGVALALRHLPARRPPDPAKRGAPDRE